MNVFDRLLAREGGYVHHPADRGGPTNFGITQQVARAYGYWGDMRELPREKALAIYRERYWIAPGFNRVPHPAIAEELLDTGVNMGPMVATRFLQRALNVLNRGGSAYPDLEVDGVLGRMTLYALDQFLLRRPEGAPVLLKLLNALQAVRYVEIAEARPTQEEFLYGWIRERA